MSRRGKRRLSYLVLTLWRSQGASTFTPRGGARRDGRTRTPGAQFWRLPFWPLNYVPMKLETARQGFPCERLPACANCAYPEASPAVIPDGRACEYDPRRSLSDDRVFT